LRSQLFQRALVQPRDRAFGRLGQLRHRRDAGFMQFLDLPDGDARDTHQVIALFEEAFGMRRPLVMIRSRQRLGAIVQMTCELLLHQQERLADVPIEVDEILQPELDALFGAEDDAETIRCRGAGHRGQHLGVATELNRIEGLGRAGELRIPDCIAAGLIQHQKVGIAGELTAL
jgi:hypothetical protein